MAYRAVFGVAVDREKSSKVDQGLYEFAENDDSSEASSCVLILEKAFVSAQDFEHTTEFDRVLGKSVAVPLGRKTIHNAKDQATCSISLWVKDKEIR